MTTLIAYASKHGCAEKGAVSLQQKLTGQVEMVNLKEKKKLDINNYDTVIIGGSIYMGKIQKEISQFCEKNKQQLLTKKMGIYICCMREGEDARTQLETSFPPEIFASAQARGIFGGEYKLSKMNFMERLIVRKVAGVEEDETTLSAEEINKFAEVMNNG